MLDLRFRKPLELHVDDGTLRFDGKADFEFALSSRTEIPAAKIAELVRFNLRQLLDDASSVRQVERHFVEVLSRSIQEPGSIGYLLRETDMKLFSQDHQWRPIMQALAQHDGGFDEYKQLALVKYVQYLASRQDVLKGIYHYKSAADDGGDDGETEAATQLHETLIFDVSDAAACAVRARSAAESDPDTHAPERLERLPRGENVRLRQGADEAVEIVLSRHGFEFRPGATPVLRDANGNQFELKTGRNVIGRHPDSDVTVNAAHRDVSRTHLIVELDSDGTLCLTDLSSHGTFVPARLVERVS